MCGRFVISSPAVKLAGMLGLDQVEAMPPRYNIAPTQPIPVLRQEGDRRSLMLMRWGFLPGWVKDPREFSLIINARVETALEKPSFRNAFRRRRCLIPADGFYEWKKEGAGKMPWFIHRADGAPMTFAGLYETWMGPNGEEVDTACILTCTANRFMAPLHERMPVIVPTKYFDPWLDCAAFDAPAAHAFCQPAPDDLLVAHPVSKLVNRASADGPELIAQQMSLL